MVRKLNPSIKLSEKWWGMTLRGPDLVWRQNYHFLSDLKSWKLTRKVKKRENFLTKNGPKWPKNDPNLLGIALGWTWRVNLPFFEGPTYVWGKKRTKTGVFFWHEKVEFWRNLGIKIWHEKSENESVYCLEMLQKGQNRSFFGLSEAWKWSKMTMESFESFKRSK